VVNPLDKEEITEEVLNTLAVEDALAEDFCQLSLNALSSANTDNSIKLRTLVKNKVMLVLLDLGSSHSFISSSFVAMANLPTIPVTTKTVKLANGQPLNAQAKVLNLPWYVQGHTLHSDMLVIDMGPYDAILGFDWLKLHSPMQCDWSNKTLTFTHDGKTVTIQGLQTPPLQATPISPTQLYKAAKGNDTWAFVMLQQTSEPNPDTPSTKLTNLDLQTILTKYPTVFQDPTNFTTTETL